jgi:hypothetical protein
MAFIISADDIKKSLPGYDPNHSDKLHRESARLADKEYEKALKNRPENTVILMSGGTASGKTEYISAYLRPRKVIILDGTLPTFEGAKIKIRKALKKKKKVEIHTVMPFNLETAFVAFLNRDRKFPPEHFFRTHSSSRKTLLDIAKNFPDIPMRIFFSQYRGNDSRMDTVFAELPTPDRGKLIAFLENNQYTEETIKRMTRTL